MNSMTSLPSNVCDLTDTEVAQVFGGSTTQQPPQFSTSSTSTQPPQLHRVAPLSTTNQPPQI
jgi:hypothetical protein